MEAVDLDRERLRLQPIALARLAELVRLVARQLLGHPGGLGLAPAPLDIVDHALERFRGRVAPHAVVIGESDLVLARAVQDHVAEFLGQVLPRPGHRLAIGAGKSLQRLLVIGRGRARARPGGDRAAREAQALVGHDQLRLEEELGAEPVAFGAGAIRVVEGEEARLDLLDGEAGHGAGELRREDDALLVAPMPVLILASSATCSACAWPVRPVRPGDDASVGAARSANSAMAMPSLTERAPSRSCRQAARSRRGAPRRDRPPRRCRA